MSIRRSRLVAIRACCPRLAELIREFADAPVAEYAARLWQPPPHAPSSHHSRQARGHVLKTLKHSLETEARLPLEELENALRQFEQYPIFQTADHAQLLLDPISFHTNLLYYMGAGRVGARTLFVNACSTVTLETRQGQGPGWLNLRDARINLFALGRRSLTGHSVCAAPGAVRFHFETQPARNALTGREEFYLNRVRDLIGGETFEGVADAFAAANVRLWRSWDREERTALVYTDDRLVASIVAHHLSDEESIIRRMLFEPEIRERLERELGRAGQGVGGMALRRSTQFFWGARGGRIRPLRLTEGSLQETRTGEGIEMAFQPEPIVRGLLEGRLYPDLFTGFLALAVLPRIKVLGGPSQMIYLPIIAEVCARTLDELGGEFRDLRDELRCGQSDCWIAGAIEAAEHPLSLLAEHPEGLQLESLAELYAHASLEQSMGEMSLFDYLKGWADATNGAI